MTHRLFRTKAKPNRIGIKRALQSSAADSYALQRARICPTCSDPIKATSEAVVLKHSCLKCRMEGDHDGATGH